MADMLSLKIFNYKSSLNITHHGSIIYQTSSVTKAYQKETGVILNQINP